MTSLRPEGDTAWDYLRPLPAVKPFLRFEERGDNIFELVCLDGLPSKSTHNRPDKSYATKDLFSKHPIIESAYKYFSRLDDTIVLANGEKANPLMVEGTMRGHKFVAEAVAFGAGKASLGLMIIPSDAAANLSREGLLDTIWPSVESAQASMPTYARLSRSMVVILPPNTIYPCTDKGTVIRQAFYRQFQQDIEDAYEENEAGGHLTLSEEGLRDFLRKEVAMILQLEDASILSDDADFFSLGMDSLQSTQLRGILVRSINTRGAELSLNVVFEHPSLRSLALRLHSLRGCQKEMANTTEDEMHRLIAKYGVFTNNIPRPNGLEGSREHSIVVTGATGSLGAHVVVDLVTRNKVKRVYCLARASSAEHAQSRVVQSLKTRKLYDSLPTSCKEKIIALPSNFGLPGLDLEPQQYDKIATEVTSLIHCAWSVNFNLRLTSFEKDIAGIKHLIELCLDSRQTKPAIFSFCSSISTMLNAESDTILEALPAKLSDAQNTGYAQSKLVAENLCQIAADQTGMTTHILRIGQIVGDTKNGIWNANEAIPMTLQTSTTINALPQLDEWHRWLPVDRVAKIVTEITQSNASSGVANIVNPNAFHWTKDLLPYVKASGLQFSELNPREWIQRLRFSNPDPVTNPPVMLLEFFANNYNKDVPPRLPPEWRTAKSQRWSRTFAEGFIIDQVLVDKIIGYFTSSCWSVP
jgi:thioester reductase-like protein